MTRWENLPLPGKSFLIMGNRARSIPLEEPRERTGAPRSERMHPCLHMQLMSSSHPPQQSLFGRHRSSPSIATDPAQPHYSNQNNGNLPQKQPSPCNVRVLSCHTRVQPRNAVSSPALTLSRPGCSRAAPWWIRRRWTRWTRTSRSPHSCGPVGP